MRDTVVVITFDMSLIASLTGAGNGAPPASIAFVA
jgi:hypothetical protein